jgi:predicted Zn-dependent protease
VRHSLKQIAPRDLLKLAPLDLALDRPRHAEAALGEYLLREPADPRGHRQLAEVYRRTRQPEREQAAIKLASALEAKALR